MHPHVRLALVSAAIVVAVLVLIGATYQGVATALERRRYPHPGELVDVGGHQLHIYCRGEGTPTVVLEAPAGEPSPIWGWVQPEIARTTRVCSYDRAGLGWSEAGDRPYDPGRVPEELHALLTAADQAGPYLLVGHSLGTAFVRRFAGLYPADTAGLVLIDAPDGISDSAAFIAAAPWLARTGVLRATRMLSDSWQGLPPESAGAVSTFLHRPDHLTRASREVARWNDAVRLGDAAPLPRRLPIVTASGNLQDERAARAIVRAIVSLSRAPSSKR
jgi:pimeloyl-ACP methyl ester carboxylesterase